MRKTFLIAVALAGFVPADRAIAGGMQVTSSGVQVTSSDATSRFMALGVSKSVVIDMPTDIKDVVVGDKGIAIVVIQSRRRVYITGAALGQTNVYFYGTDGQQIDALNIAVTALSMPSEMDHYTKPANVVLVYYGTGRIQPLSCTLIMCVDAGKPGADQPPGTQNINITGNATGVSLPSR